MWKTLGGFSAQISRYQNILPLSTAQINCSVSDLPFFRKPSVVPIWLQDAGQEPWRMNCNQWRDDLLAMGLPERSGFQLDPKALPPSWDGLGGVVQF